MAFYYRNIKGLLEGVITSHNKYWTYKKKKRCNRMNYLDCRAQLHPLYELKAIQASGWYMMFDLFSSRMLLQILY